MYVKVCMYHGCGILVIKMRDQSRVKAQGPSLKKERGGDISFLMVSRYPSSYPSSLARIEEGGTMGHRKETHSESPTQVHPEWVTSTQYKWDLTLCNCYVLEKS